MPPDNVTSVPTLIRRRRAELGLSQTELARMAHLAPQVVAITETRQAGHYKPATLRALAHALDLDLGELLAAAGYLPRGARVVLP